MGIYIYRHRYGLYIYYIDIVTDLTDTSGEGNYMYAYVRICGVCVCVSACVYVCGSHTRTHKP